MSTTIEAGLSLTTTSRRHLGARLRRFRRLAALKQAHVADLLGVSQGIVSRWETGAIPLSEEHSAKVEGLISTPPSTSTDCALRRLVESAKLPVHLICDATHVLLAAPPSREREWGSSAAPFLGASLWRFATDEIVIAEEALAAQGWFERAGSSEILVPTSGNGSTEMQILPSVLEWEQIALAGGRLGRLVTTISFDAPNK